MQFVTKNALVPSTNTASSYFNLTRCKFSFNLIEARLLACKGEGKGVSMGTARPVLGGLFYTLVNYCIQLYTSHSRHPPTTTLIFYSSNNNLSAASTHWYSNKLLCMLNPRHCNIASTWTNTPSNWSNTRTSMARYPLMMSHTVRN